MVVPGSLACLAGTEQLQNRNNASAWASERTPTLGQLAGVSERARASCKIHANHYKLNSELLRLLLTRVS